MHMHLVPDMRVRVSVGLLALLILAIFAISSKSSVNSPHGAKAKEKLTQASSDQFVWRVDLHLLGYPTDDAMLQRRRGLHDFDTLDFVSDTIEVATFLTQEPAHDLRRRDAPNPPPYTLHAVFLDVRSGKVLKILEWPIDDPNAGIFSRYDGSFLFFSTQRILLYSRDWKAIKELPLPQLKAVHATLLDIAVAPSGKVVVIRFLQDRSSVCIRIMTDTLEGSEEACETQPRFTISDEAMAAPKGRERRKEIDSGPELGPPLSLAGPFNYSISIRAKAGEGEHNLCESHEPSAGYCLTPQFISNGRIVLFGGEELSLSDLQGRATVIFKQSPYSDNLWIDPNGRPVHPSADGQRFALALNESAFHVFGGSGTLYASASELPAEYPDRIQVFDVEMNNWIYVLHNKNRQFSKVWGLALSPSGDRLTLDSGGVIQTYALPVTVTAPAR